MRPNKTMLAIIWFWPKLAPSGVRRGGGTLPVAGLEPLPQLFLCDFYHPRDQSQLLKGETCNSSEIFFLTSPPNINMMCSLLFMLFLLPNAFHFDKKWNNALFSYIFHLFFAKKYNFFCIWPIKIHFKGLLLCLWDSLTFTTYN